MRARRILLMVALVASATVMAVPVQADDDGRRGWRSADRGGRVYEHDDGWHDDRHEGLIDQHERIVDRHERLIVRRGGGHAQGTTGPYWGTMRPYWGNMAPSTIRRGTGRRGCD